MIKLITPRGGNASMSTIKIPAAVVRDAQLPPPLALRRKKNAPTAIEGEYLESAALLTEGGQLAVGDLFYDSSDDEEYSISAIDFRGKVVHAALVSTSRPHQAPLKRVWDMGYVASHGARTLAADVKSHSAVLGRTVRKSFPPFGTFVGTVVGFDSPFYSVVYSDGDQEEMTLEDLQSLLLSPPSSVDDTAGHAVACSRLSDAANFVGRFVEKEFPGHGFFKGRVVSELPAEDLFSIVYEDGDREDVSREELIKVLVPDASAYCSSSDQWIRVRAKLMVDAVEKNEDQTTQSQPLQGHVIEELGYDDGERSMGGKIFAGYRNQLFQRSGGDAARAQIAGKTKKSCFLGVSWHSRDKRWVAKITCDTKTYHLGNFVHEEAAARKYDESASPLGRPLNFPADGEESVDKRCTHKSSLFVGVHWSIGQKKWIARIRVDGKKVDLGSFSDEKAAARKYDEAAARIGRKLNFPAMRDRCEAARVMSNLSLDSHEVLKSRVSRFFPGFGMFHGTVSSKRVAGNKAWFQVAYDDGDAEEYDLDEIESMLSPKFKKSRGDTDPRTKGAPGNTFVTLQDARRPGRFKDADGNTWQDLHLSGQDSSPPTVISNGGKRVRRATSASSLKDFYYF